MMRARHLLVVGALAFVLGACGGSPGSFPDDAFAVRVSSDIGLGSERLLIGVSSPDGTRHGSPEDGLTFEVAPADAPAEVQRAPATYTWILEDVIGLYRAEFEFDRPGIWDVTVIPDEGDPLDPVPFEVRATPLAPAIGAVAPLPDTPTLADLPLAELTTDRNPDPRLYEVSLPDAVASGTPTVLAFATPAYCQTAACGPILEVVKAMIDSYAGVNFIHVEVYTGFNEPDFVPDVAHLAPAVGSSWYQLPSEPWVFVIDGSGRIAGRFEGVVDRAELSAVLDLISL